MLLLRKILFYFFLLIYVVFCPMTIFYALGFVYKPGSEHGIIKTGLVYVSTVPTGATVFLNGMKYEGTTPAVIRNLDPGYYKVRVELQGHHVWDQEVPVEAERASVLEKILLLPTQQKKTQVSTDAYKTLTSVESTPFVILSKGSELKDYFVFDSKNKKTTPILIPALNDPHVKVSQLYSVSRSPKILLRLEKDKHPLFYQIDLDQSEPPKDLTSLFAEMPEKILWENSRENHLISFHEGLVDYLRADKKLVYPKIAGNVRGIGIEDKNLILLRGDHTIAEMSLDGKNEKILLKDAVLGESLFGTKGFYKIEVLSHDSFLFLGEKGELISNHLPYRFAHAEVKGYEYAAKQKKLLVWTDREVGLIDFSKLEEAESELFEKGPRLIWVYTNSKSIQKASWIYDASHILFQDKDRLYFLDMETFNRPELHEVLKLKDDSFYTYSDQTGVIYFLDHESGKLSSSEILPKRELLLLPFPTRQEKLVKRRIFQR